MLVDATGAVHLGPAAGGGPPGLVHGLGNSAYTAALLTCGQPCTVADWELHEARLRK